MRAPRKHDYYIIYIYIYITAVQKNSGSAKDITKVFFFFLIKKRALPHYQKIISYNKLNKIYHHLITRKQRQNMGKNKSMKPWRLDLDWIMTMDNGQEVWHEMERV